MTIRIILRSPTDGLFVSGVITWSPHEAEAQVFPNAKAADEFVRSHRLKNMEIVVLRENVPQLRVPLDCRATE